MRKVPSHLINTEFILQMKEGKIPLETSSHTLVKKTAELTVTAKQGMPISSILKHTNCIWIVWYNIIFCNNYKPYHMGCMYVGGSLGWEIGVQLYDLITRSARRKFLNKLATRRSCLKSLWNKSKIVKT